MEITKKDLLNLINESNNAEMDEMARKPFGNQAQRTKEKEGGYRGEREDIIHQYRGHWLTGNDTEIANFWTVNLHLIPGEEEIVIPCDCNETQNFIDSNKDWFMNLMREHNKEYVNVIACKSPLKYKPRSTYSGFKFSKSGEAEPGQFDYRPTKPHEPASLNKNISDKFNAICYEYLGEHTEGGHNFNLELNKRSIPAIFMDPSSETFKHYNKYVLDQRTNDNIEFTTVSYNGYPSAKQFVNCALARMTGDQGKIKAAGCDDTFHMARQHTKVIKWEKERPGTKAYLGKAKKYKVFIQGYRPTDYNILIRSELDIVGKRTSQNTFSWKISMTADYGQKAPSEFNMGNMSEFFDPEKPIVVTKVATIDPQKQFTENRGETIMDDLEVTNALIAALEEFQNEVKKINPREVLNAVRVSEKDVPGGR